MTSVKELEDWLRDSKAGDKRPYYLGFLAVDRVVSELVDGVYKDRLIEPANTIGNVMWQAYEAGLVTLWQERLSEWEYRYWAQRREADANSADNSGSDTGCGCGSGAENALVLAA